MFYFLPVRTASETPRNLLDNDDIMGVVGAEADDAEAEFIREICEKELMFGLNLLPALTPLILAGCSNLSKVTFTICQPISRR